MHKNTAHLARGRRSLATLVSATMVLSGTLVLTALSATPASAAVLGSITVSPTSGNDTTLFGGEIANAQCPAGTAESYFSIDGSDLPADQAFLGPGNATGTGAQSFSGASIANVKSANSGSFASSGPYTIRFNCVSDAGVSDTYNTTLNYTAGGSGAYTITVPATAPGAPTIGTATAGNGSASVAFTAPASDGGSAITGYTVTSTPGGLTATGAGSPLTVSGLANGTAYTFKVRATNAVGPGPDSAASNSVTPAAPAATAPGAPTIGTATAGNGSASVAFTAPASDGGSAITGYTVTSTPGGISASGPSSPITVPGLANGTAYTFKVKATNAVGPGPDSAASNSVTPAAAATAPGAPTIGTATAGNGSASVAFTAPASDGGSPITSYTVTSTPGGISASGPSSPITVPGLANGTAYTFKVKATNAVGPGPDSAASNSVTPSVPTVPGAPVIGTATPGNASATVAFTAPASAGSSPITSYTVTSTPGGITASGPSSPITVPGLANGTAYTFKVKATNAVGPGPDSAASNSVTPAAPAATAPGAPTIGTATAGNASATVAFTAPTNAGSSPITSYTVTSTPGGISASGPSSPITVPGLTNGTAYTFKVKATNAVGPGPDSAASNVVTPTGTAPVPTFRLGTNVIAAGQFTKVVITGTPGDTIQILVKGAASSTYTVIATRIPNNSAGITYVNISPSTTSSYYVRNAAGAAPAKSLLVKAVQSLVGKASGGTGIFTGHVAPSVVGRTVSVYYYVTGGHVRLAGVTKTVQGGQFKVTHRFAPGQKIHVFAQTSADKYNAAGRSPVVNLTLGG